MKAYKLSRAMLIASAAFLYSASYASYASADSDVITAQHEETTAPIAIDSNIPEPATKDAVAIPEPKVDIPEPKQEPKHEHIIVKQHHPRRGYLNGYKGYRYARPNYIKFVDGWYYPEAAYSAKPAVEAAAKEAQTPVISYVRLPNRHIAYCVSHFKSYRKSDNSFQPYSGARQQCHSRFYKG